MLDLSGVPVLDNHCHFFSLEHSEKPLHRLLTLSLHHVPDDQLRHSLLYRMLLSSLGNFLGCSSDEREVLESRDEAARRDYRAYVNALFDSVGLTTLVVDTGLQKSSVDNSRFESLVARKVRYVYRTETVVDRLWREQVDPESGLRIFQDEVRSGATALKAIALKSIIGYRTGLEVDPAVTASKVSRHMDEASYRNLFFLESARLCQELGIPLHVHAAFGESNIDLRKNNPIHLKSFMESKSADGLDVVLIHGGYPYAFEAGYMAAMYPRLHVDLSELIPFVPLGARRGVEDILSMAPWNKVMYGSDGFDIPETHWIGALMGKQILGDILGDLVESGTIDASYAMEAARMMLHENSLRLHGGTSPD